MPAASPAALGTASVSTALLDWHKQRPVDGQLTRYRARRCGRQNDPDRPAGKQSQGRRAGQTRRRRSRAERDRIR